MRRTPLIILCLLASLSHSLFGQIRPEEAELHLALQLGDVQRTLIAFEGSADPSAVDDRGYTALNYAAASPTAEVIAYVLRNGAEYDPAKHIEAPILTAAKYGNYKQGMVLLQSGHDGTALDDSGWNALFFAAARNDGPFVSLLLQNGVPIQPTAGRSYSALHHAARHGAAQALYPMLRQYGGDPTTTDEKGWTPLHYAAQAGHAKAAQILVDAGADANAQALGGVRPLHLAAAAGHHQVVSTLLGKGALVMLPDSAGANAIHLASTAGHLNVLQNLLGKGAETNVPDGKGKFPLQLAVENGHAMVCKSLLRAGAAKELGRLPSNLGIVFSGTLEELKQVVLNKSAANKEEFGTPLLCWAIRSGKAEMADYLLEMGADPTAQDAQGMAAVHLAVRFALQDLAARLASDPKGRSLKDGRGRTPAHVAVDCNRFLLLEKLLDEKVVEMKDASGASLLHAAAASDIPLKTLPILFAAKNLPDLTNRKGQLPLHVAVKSGNVEAVKRLLAYGKKQMWMRSGENNGLVNKADGEGNTPVHYAALADNAELVKLLLEAGAVKDMRNAAGHTAAELALENWSLEAFGVLMGE